MKPAIAIATGALSIVLAFPAMGAPSQAERHDRAKNFSVDFCKPGVVRAAPDCDVLCANPSAATVQQVDACVDAQPATPLGGGAGGTLDWVSIGSDFFVARLKGELMLFLQTELSGVLCSADSSAPKQLLVNTCPILTATDVNTVAQLPAAFKRDLEALPTTLPKYIVSLVKNDLSKFSMTERDAVCVALILPVAYRDFRVGGAIGALQGLAAVASPDPQCDVIVHRANSVAKWLSGVLPKAKTTSSAQLASEVFGDRTAKTPLGGELDSVLASLAAQSMLDTGNSATITDIQRFLTAHRAELQQLISELLSLVSEYQAGNRSDDVVDQIADDTMHIVAILMSASDETSADLQTLGQAIADFATKRYIPGILQLASVKVIDTWLEKDPKKVWEAFVKWAGLIGGLASAKTSDDAEKILEGAAAPIGSYREFRSGIWRGFISGYAGVVGGYDWVREAKGAPVAAPMLPVGFEVGHAIGHSCSFNAMISIIDLGAPAASRLSSSDTTSDSMGTTGTVKTANASWRSIFAPGAFVSIGLGKSPFLAGAGVELLPEATERFDCPTSAACSTTTTSPTIRGMLFFAVDLTALPVF